MDWQGQSPWSQSLDLLQVPAITGDDSGGRWGKLSRDLEPLKSPLRPVIRETFVQSLFSDSLSETFS